jgi:DNA-binding transcriptional MerR regulator/methanogenic corrinoid protein MtbC1
VLRVWERRYGAVQPTRTPGNRRLYSPHQVKRLQLLCRATHLGFAIGQVASLPAAELEGLVAEAGPIDGLLLDAREPHAFLSAAQRATQGLDPGDLAGVLGQAFGAIEVPAVLHGLVVPLLHWVGDRWEDGSLSIAHEHMASAIVRTFLGGLVTGSQPDSAAPCILMATPSGQLHELGTLLAAIAALQEGWRAVYFGPDLPAQQIADAAHRRKAHAVALGITYPSDDPRLPAELRRLRQGLPDATHLLVGGRAVTAYGRVLEEVGAQAPADLLEFTGRLAHISGGDPKAME